MKSATLLNIKTLSVLGLLAFGLAACDNAVFSSDGGRNKTTTDVTEEGVDDLIFIDDSFERNDIYFIDNVNNVTYGWRGFVRDGNTNVLDFTTPSGAGATIPPAADVGPAFDGVRALYTTGDADADVEVVQVISQTFDLSQYNTAVLSFRYMTFGLNDADDTTPETLELQVCKGTLNECGANDDVLFPAGLLSNNWVTVFSSANDNVNDDAFNGKNHTATDWRPGLAVIDLNNPEFVGSSSTFVFRFVTTVRGGANRTQTCTEVCEKICDGDDGDDGDDGGGHSCKKKKHTSMHGKNHSHHKVSSLDLDLDELFDLHGCGNDSHGKRKFWVCHKNHGKKKEKNICISESALPAHIGRHSDRDGETDYIGKCKDNGGGGGECHTECHQECVPGDGTYTDGAAVDKVVGRASVLTIDEIF